MKIPLPIEVCPFPPEDFSDIDSCCHNCHFYEVCSSPSHEWHQKALELEADHASGFSSTLLNKSRFCAESVSVFEGINKPSDDVEPF